MQENCFLGSNPYDLGMTISPRELRAFLAVVENGTLGLAARDIHITQPALSRLIRHLEERLKQPLFERHTTGMVPTAAGAALLPHARLLLFEMDQAVEGLDALRGMKRGTVRIGTVAAANRGVVSEALCQLLKLNPGLKAEVVEGPDDRVVAALLGRSVDVIVAADDLQQEDIVMLDGTACLETCFMPFCAPTHPLAKKRKVTVEQVFAERWVMTFKNSTPVKLLHEVARKLGREPPTIAIEITSPDAIARYVADSSFLGWLPESLIQHYERHGLLHTLDVKELRVPRRLYAYRRQRGILAPAAQRFVEILRSIASKY